MLKRQTELFLKFIPFANLNSEQHFVLWMYLETNFKNSDNNFFTLVCPLYTMGKHTVKVKIVPSHKRCKNDSFVMEFVKCSA